MENYLINPTEYQLENARLVAKILASHADIIDVYERLETLIINNDKAFEAWDNIAAEFYELLGGQYEPGTKNATNERIYEQCKDNASDLIINIFNRG